MAAEVVVDDAVVAVAEVVVVAGGFGAAEAALTGAAGSFPLMAVGSLDKYVLKLMWILLAQLIRIIRCVVRMEVRHAVSMA